MSNVATPHIQNSQLRLYVLAVSVYLSAFLLYFSPNIQQHYTNQAVKNQLSSYMVNNHQDGPVQEQVSGPPAQISIKRLNINLPVSAGYYNAASKKWTLDNKHVFTDNFTNSNPVISTKQDNVTVLYGHDLPGLLVNTSQVAYGDILSITTTNGYRFNYYYVDSRVVKPDDTSILHEKNTGNPVALVTCTGAWYQNRRVMYFKLIDAVKIPLTSADLRTK